MESHLDGGATSAEMTVETHKLVVEVESLQLTEEASESTCIEFNFGGQRHRTGIKENHRNLQNESFYFDVSKSNSSWLPRQALEIYVYDVQMVMRRNYRFQGNLRIPATSLLPLPHAEVRNYPLDSQYGGYAGELGLKIYTIGGPSPPPPMDSVVCCFKRDPQCPALYVSSNLEGILQSSRPHDINLEDITNNFSDERIIGKGGFGVVYKGVLQNGEMIAVKKIVSSLMSSLQKQFENEVYHLMMLKHPNIVRCIGYCYETRNTCLAHNGKRVFAEVAERLICLEYLPKGSLDKYLSDASSGLDWSTHYHIIEGICYGLCHLHEHNDNPIIHLDLKPANVLLDDCMIPKITDFGLSRQLGQQQTTSTSSRHGTLR